MSSSKKRGSTATGKTARRGATRSTVAAAARGSTSTRPARGGGDRTPNARKGAARPIPRPRGGAAATRAADGPSFVVGVVSPLARVAGVLATLAALCQLLAPAFPLVTERGGAGGAGGAGFGGAANALDFAAPLAVAVVLGGAGVLSACGTLPRLGLAAIAAFGVGSVGLLLQTAYLYDTSARTSRDLPLPEAMVRTFRYGAATGLHLRLVAELLAVAAFVLAVRAWSRTWMEDDGGFDALRPLFAGLGLFAGVLGVAGMCFAGAESDVSVLGPQSVVSRAGLDAAGTAILAAVVLGCGVVAPSLRPRQATVGMFAGLAALTGAEALRTGLLVARSESLEFSIGGVTQTLAAVAFALLSVGAWRMSRDPLPEDDVP